MATVKSDITQQWLEMSKNLKEWELAFIKARQEGTTYERCHEMLTTNFSESTGKAFPESSLRCLTMNSGRLKEHFECYSEMMAVESFNEGQRALKSAHRVATATLISLLRSKYPSAVRLGASKDILDRNAGRATQKIEQTIDTGEQTREDIKTLIEAMTNGKQD